MGTSRSSDKLSTSELEAWQGFLRTGARIQRILNQDLERMHGLSGNDYDVLIQLGTAPKQRLRMSTVAQQVLMSPSGLSRLVDQLQREGLVVRERTPDDARSFEITLTSEGRRRLKEANRTHLARVRELFLDPMSETQLAHLAQAWKAIDPALTTGDWPSQ